MQQLLQSLARISLSGDEYSELKARLQALEDWQAFLRDAELNAIVPLIYRHFEEHKYQPPAEVKLSLKALQLRHRAAANARYQLMQELQNAFSEASIPLVGLKGVALAPMLYQEDYLRPMRDVDVLVPAESQTAAGEILRSLGFDLPEQQPSRFMRDSHQLPNATRQVNGFTISVEIHHDAISRDVPGSLKFCDVVDELKTVQWRELQVVTLGHEHMLHQVCLHLAGLHPGAVLKLINVLDVVLYAEKYIGEIDWARVARDYPHVVNTLRCLHYIVPLSASLQSKVGGVPQAALEGVGETMQPFVMISNSKQPLLQKLSALLAPPEWWMYLYYNVDPDKSLLITKLVRHPLNVIFWVGKRLYSGLLGG